MSRKFLIYCILILIVIGVLFYFFGSKSLFAGLAALGGLGTGEAINKLKSKQKQLESNLSEIEKKEEKLKKDGVEDKTSQEEVDYWKNQ